MAEALTKAGRYQIMSELGRGSMGVVYQGFDPVIGRTVAIKTMLTEDLTPQEFQEFRTRFQREAQAAGILSHPNIINVFDYGEEGGVLYLVMEYLEGKSLEKLVEEQTILPIQTIIPICVEVCSALDHAHQHDIVHRDVKPANIMILNSGPVKVTDFGIAKMMSMGMTKAGQILGTPNYMSPEQVKGRQVDGRSDIFSLGVILYELVTGEKPFGGQNITTVIFKIINQDPIPPRELDATIHPGLSYVICKALAKSPDERYQTCRELADDLKNFKSLTGQAAPSATVVLRVPVASLQSESSEPPAVAPVESSTPPAAVPQLVQPAPVEQPQPRPLSVQLIPPVTSKRPPVSPIVWVLLTVLAVGIIWGGGHFLFNRQKAPVQTAPQVVGQLSIAANIPGARIAVDGHTEPEWVTPYTVSDLSAGIHQVVVSMDGHSDYQQAVTIEQGKTDSITANLPAAPGPETPGKRAEVARAKASKEASESTGGIPLPTAGGGRSGATKIGQLLVTSNVSGAEISVDGRKERGCFTPCTVPGLAVGFHEVVVSKEGFDDYDQAVTVESGKTYTVTANLSPPTGEVRITTKPAGYEVLIDGKLMGQSPVQASLGAGSHRYAIQRPGLQPYQNTFTIESGAIKDIAINLNGPGAVTGIVEVRTVPSGASVLADDNPVAGQTPTSFRLSSGRHTLVISLTGSKPVQRMVDVPANGTVKVDVRLQ